MMISSQTQHVGQVICRICLEVPDILVLSDDGVCYKCEAEGWKKK